MLAFVSPGTPDSKWSSVSQWSPRARWRATSCPICCWRCCKSRARRASASSSCSTNHSDRSISFLASSTWSMRPKRWCWVLSEVESICKLSVSWPFGWETLWGWLSWCLLRWRSDLARCRSTGNFSCCSTLHKAESHFLLIEMLNSFLFLSEINVKLFFL